MGKAGLLQSPRRGVHLISDRGLEFLSKNPSKLDNRDLKQFKDFSDWQETNAESSSSLNSEQQSKSSGDDDQTPEDAIQTAFRTLNKALKDELVAELQQVPPARFEQLILDLLSAMGFGGGKLTNKLLTPISGDGGIDGIINEDSLGLDAVYIQAKRYAQDNKVGRPDIQRFVGSLTGESATKGVFVTTSDFSKEAVQYIDRVQQRIVLINGQRLAQLMIEHGIGVRTRSVYELKSLDEDYFSRY
ncbi:restriction endonuclease [Shimia thalassica]|nr:restriction endonuclease [Shimia thalassica]